MSKIPRYKLTHLFKRMQDVAHDKRQQIYAEQQAAVKLIFERYPYKSAAPIALLDEFWTLRLVTVARLKAAKKRALAKHNTYPGSDHSRSMYAIVMEITGTQKFNDQQKKKRDRATAGLGKKTDKRITAINEYMRGVEDVYMLDSEANLINELEAFKARKF